MRTFLGRVNTGPAVAALALALLAACGAKSAKPPVAKTYELPAGTLRLMVPADWADKSRPTPRGLPPMLMYSPAKGKSFQVLVTPLPMRWPEGAEAAAAEVKKLVEMALAPARGMAVETEIHILEFQGTGGPGFYFSATDRSPKPGEYKHMAQGVLRVQDLAVSFTVLANEDKEQVLGDALAMLKSAVREGAAGASDDSKPFPDAAGLMAGSVSAPGTGGDNPVPAGGSFLYEMENPRVRVSIPELPYIPMGPHPMAAAKPGLLAMGAVGNYVVSVKMTSADPGMSAVECATSLSGSIKVQQGLNDSDYRLRKSADNTTFAMYYSQSRDKFLFLKAHLFSAYGGTHCIETHITKSNAAAEEVQDWMKGFPLGRIDSSGSRTSSQAAPQAAAQAVPPATAGDKKTDAYFSVPRAPKGKIDLAAYAGRPVLLFLFRDDCPSCQKAATELEILYSDYKDEGLRVIGLSMSSNPAKIRAFADDYGLSFPLGYSAADVFRRYNPQGVPFFVLLNKQHKVVSTWRGYNAVVDPQMTEAIEKVVRSSR